MIKRATVLATLLALSAASIPLLWHAGAETPGLTAGRVRERFQPNKGKIFVLVIGNDARSGNPNAVRADALHLIGINTKTMRGGILNFPRDSYVTIAGRGPGRINEALYRGGPQLQVKTVESITGIKIDYWVMTGFEGFRKIIKGIKGVPITFKTGMFDPGGSGANIKAGTKRLSAEPALAFVRTRKSLRGGDVARTANQARFLLALLRKFRTSVEKNPATLLRWMSLTQRNTRLDLSAEEMFRLGVLASQLPYKRVRSVTVPVTIGSVGGASVVFIQPRARKIYARFKRSASL